MMVFNKANMPMTVVQKIKEEIKNKILAGVKHRKNNGILMLFYFLVGLSLYVCSFFINTEGKVFVSLKKN
jgi:hypothetical protein